VPLFSAFIWSLYLEPICGPYIWSLLRWRAWCLFWGFAVRLQLKAPKWCLYLVPSWLGALLSGAFLKIRCGAAVAIATRHRHSPRAPPDAPRLHRRTAERVCRQAQAAQMHASAAGPPQLGPPPTPSSSAPAPPHFPAGGPTATPTSTSTARVYPQAPPPRTALTNAMQYIVLQRT
jgi:hypothetical protein